MNTHAAIALALALSTQAVGAGEPSPAPPAQIGPRPFFLVDDMDDGALKERLRQCESGPFYRTDFSIAHRGAPLMFPEHTKESYLAAARMGAGILECDVTFTKDRQLVCRHSQCDLHTTTDILAHPEIAAQCSQSFRPADPAIGAKASARCCTSDITLAEFRKLKGKMDAANEKARTVAEYMDATASWRTDLHASRGTLMTHAESIALFKELGVKMTPELKEPEVAMPFDGDYTRQAYAAHMIAEYEAAGVDPSSVFAQSFDLVDVKYWVDAHPEFGSRAVWLDGRYSVKSFKAGDPSTWSPTMEELAAAGVTIIAPPIAILLAEGPDGRPVPSVYAQHAKAAGLKIITWSLERSGPLAAGGGFYYRSVRSQIDNDGDMLTVLDVLAKDVGAIGVFSDWPATTTFYANCMGLE